MPDAFAITAAASTVALDGTGKGETSFTVSNATGRPLRIRAVVAPTEPAKAEWFAIAGEAERETPLGGTQQYTVRISVPAGTPAGTYQFRLGAHAEDRPEEDYSQGPTVAFTVAAAQPKKRFPWWIVAAAAAAVLLIAVAFVVLGDGDDEEAADPVTMPDLVGLPQSQAVAQLQALGVTVASTRPLDPAVPPGPDDCIALQVPFPGDPVDEEGAALATAPCPSPETPTFTIDPGIRICDIQPVLCEFGTTDLTIPFEDLQEQLEDQFRDFAGP